MLLSVGWWRRALVLASGFGVVGGGMLGSLLGLGVGSWRRPLVLGVVLVVYWSCCWVLVVSVTVGW